LLVTIRLRLLLTVTRAEKFGAIDANYFKVTVTKYLHSKLLIEETKELDDYEYEF
jgi:hypothetical protein